MNDQKTSNSRRRTWSRRFLKLLVFVDGLGLIGIGVLRYLDKPMGEAGLTITGIEWSHVVSYLLVALTALALMFWVLVFGRRRFFVRVIQTLLAGLLFASPLILFEPVFGGSLWPRGWRPRFWSDVIEITPTGGTVDMATTTPFDFPQFFGQRRDGIVRQVRLNPKWDVNPPKLLWKKPVGEGWSGISAVNGYAVTMQQAGSDECITCFDLDTGDVVWNYSYKRRHEDVLGGVGPRSTPTIDDGLVYALGANGDLNCLDGANGQPVWSVNLLNLAGVKMQDEINGRGESYQVEKSTVWWGRAASPLIYKKLVIVPLGGGHSLIAFDKKTGAEVWCGGHEQVSYSSPSIGKIHGKDQILIVNESSVSGHDPATGTELWKQAREGESNQRANTSQATDVGQDRVLLTKGYGAGAELLLIDKNKDEFVPTILWESKQILKTKLTNPVVSLGYIYGLSDGILECANLTGGERLWKAPKRYGHGQVLMVGDYLVVHAENGRLVLVAANHDTFNELASIKTIRGVCWNTFCIYGDRIVVRSDREIACFRLPTID